MSELFLVRHGQASFAADDYDQLSETGHHQAAVLADYWRSLGMRFDALYSGSLKRQWATAEALLDQSESREPAVLEGFNEYVSEHILTAYREQYARADGFPEDGAELRGAMRNRRYFQRFLESACQRWVQAELESERIEPFQRFKQRVAESLETVMAENPKGRRVVVTTSGGVIAMAVQQVLAMPDDSAMSLNWVVYNSSITRIIYSGRRRSLSVFNAIPHLERPGFSDQITYR